MADTTQHQLAEQIHGRGTRFVIAVTGGGSRAISTLLAVPGASRSILAATVPYASEALVEWLGGKPDEFCSSRTARAMAMAAFLRAKQYDLQAETCGVACTASLSSDRPKRGAHRAYLAYQNGDTTAECWLELEKGRRSRAEEESLVADLLLNHVAQAGGAKDRVTLPLLESERIGSRQIKGTRDQQDLLAGRVRAVPCGAAKAGAKPRAVFSGAFHPLHAGHRRMAEIASQLLGECIALEISILNVDKPPMDFLEIAERLRQFEPDEAVWLSRAPKFTKKAELFPGATFVVGVDTMARIGNARYYGGESSALERATAQLRSAGCRFLVFPRLIGGDFCTLGELPLPVELKKLCEEVPPSVFRDDISSTQLRQNKQD